MSPEHEDFTQLCRLLALKRHEQPPPGYFDRFPGQVMARIRAGERGREATFLEWLSSEASWLRRGLELLEAKPVFAGALGAAVCAVVVAGVLLAGKPDNATIAVLSSAAQQNPPAEVTLAAQAVNAPMHVDRGAAISSTEGVSALQPSPFQQSQGGQGAWAAAVPVSYSVPDGN